jgi:FkbM family methyltransferase
MNPLDGHPLIGITDTRHGWMFYARHDRFIGPSLELYGEYSRLEIEIFAHIVGPGDVVVEAGANIGAHTLHLSRRAGTRGRVLAFEPQRQIFQILNANLMIQGRTNVEAWPICLGREPGIVEFPQIPLTDTRDFGFVSPRTTAQRHASVEVRALDSFALPACQFIKIDVEGAEPDVIAGAMATIAAHRPVLCVEADRLDGVARWFETIQALGYVFYLMLPKLFVASNWKGRADNVFGDIVAANLLAFPGPAPGWVSDPALALLPLSDLSSHRELMAPLLARRRAQ